MVNKILPRLCFGILLLYVGIAAYSEISMERLLKIPEPATLDPRIYNDIQFANSRDLWIYVHDTHRSKYYPWTQPLEEWHCLLLISVVAGGLGGIVRDVKELNARPSKKAYGVFSGLVIGPILLLVSVVYPSILQSRPAAVAAVCFLGGLFSDKAWNFVEAVGRKIFKSHVL
jgi:hypothetical protein